LEGRQRLPAPKARRARRRIACGRTARLAGGLHRAWRNDEGKPMATRTPPLPWRACWCSCNHPRSGSGLVLLPVFVGFETLFPFAEL